MSEPATPGSRPERHAGRSRHGLMAFIAIVQTILFLAHGLVFATCAYFWGQPSVPGMRLIFILVSISFVPASLLVWRYDHILASVFYRAAAFCLGILHFLFFASVACWVVYGSLRLVSWQINHRALLLVFVGGALLASVCAVLNASWVRVTQIKVDLPGLPVAWKGRTAVLAGDLHLGAVRGYGFAARLMELVETLKPDIVFLTGDVYDGTAVDAGRLAGAWKGFPAPLGIYYVTGNHEEFSDRTKFLTAVRGAGIRVLNNETVTIEGMQIAGVLYGEASDPETLRAVLQQSGLKHGQPGILLSHVPQFLEVAEEAGISLQLSGHTHKGQVWPWSWAAARVHGKFVYGLHRFKRMLVYTTSGAGTWGPPMRLGTRSEVVLIQFE